MPMAVETRSHPEMVSDMSGMTLTLTYQKFLLCISSQGQDLYSHQKLNMYIYWFSSESGYIAAAAAADDDDDDDDADNAGRHSTTTRATYRQLLANTGRIIRKGVCEGIGNVRYRCYILAINEELMNTTWQSLSRYFTNHIPDLFK